MIGGLHCRLVSEHQQSCRPEEGPEGRRSVRSRDESLPLKTLPAKVTRAVILTNAKDLFRAQVVGGEEILHFVQNDDDASLSRLQLVPVVSLKGVKGTLSEKGQHYLE